MHHQFPFLGGLIFRTDWPLMSADSQYGITVSASSTFAGLHPYNGHDGTSGGLQWAANTAGAGSWWQVQFEGYRKITSFTLTQGSSISTFDLVASNDGSSWTTIFPNFATDVSTRTISNPLPWIFYRLNCIGAADNGRFDEFTPTFGAN